MYYESATNQTSHIITWVYIYIKFKSSEHDQISSFEAEIRRHNISDLLLFEPYKNSKYGKSFLSR